VAQIRSRNRNRMQRIVRIKEKAKGKRQRAKVRAAVTGQDVFYFSFFLLPFAFFLTILLIPFFSSN
jgi:hypothetical protein